jgi:hypothetical protein
MKYNWEQIRRMRDDLFETIFLNYDINELSNLEKRTIIYDYLVNGVSYNYELLEGRKNRRPVDNNGEIVEVFTKQLGICSSISQVYKLLLEKVGIESICFCCNDGTEIYHQVLLVKDGNNYSFDDITGVIVGRGSVKDFFGYDLKKASNLNQTNFFGLPSEMIDAMIRRDSKTYNDEVYEDGFIKLPNNIIGIEYSDSYKEKINKRTRGSI